MAVRPVSVRRRHSIGMGTAPFRLQYNPLMARRCLLSMVVMVFCAAGCVRRTISISSTPPGALVWLNGREVGRTPVEVDFLYYGEYDVQLVAEGHEPVLTSGMAKPPWWDSIPFDFVAELMPGQRTAKIAWHYELHPRNDDPQALIQRAQQLRERLTPAAEAASAVPHP